jgi:hypothetical protein
MKLKVEYTDTFAGEPNYCWAHRGDIEVPSNISDAQAKRLAKRFVDLNGVDGRWAKHDDLLEFRPYKLCRVLFVSFEP